MQFHHMLQQLIRQVPQLLFNMDEIASTYNGKGKVVVQNDRFPLSEASLNIGHFTMICCINAAGFAMKLFIILPLLQKLPDELQSLAENAYFAPAPSDWVTSKLFLAWCIFFIHTLKTYRLGNGMLLKRLNAFRAPCFLFVDGHKSRLNSETIELLYTNNVRVIVFPSHTTHVLQPFDVALASPLKASIRRLGGSFPPHMLKKTIGLTPTAKNRFLVVHTLIDA